MTRHRLLQAARDALHGYNAAKDAAGKANPYQDASLGRGDAVRALDAQERARVEALDALLAVPGIDAALARFLQNDAGTCGGDGLWNELDRMLVEGEIEPLLDDLAL